MKPAILGALLVSGVAGVGMMANEGTQGGLAEAMGMGHHHMADYDGTHCAAHDGPMAAQHMAHMHGGASMPHDSCPGGGMMHGSGMPMGGMMHG